MITSVVILLFGALVMIGFAMIVFLQSKDGYYSCIIGAIAIIIICTASAVQEDHETKLLQINSHQTTDCEVKQ